MEAVSMRRELVAKNRASFLPALAMSLNNLSISLSNVGRRTEALKVAEETVSLYRGACSREPRGFLTRFGDVIGHTGHDVLQLGLL
jgi:hypothetical protein